MRECLGCRLAHALAPVEKVYEDEWVTCILDIDPFHEGHTLILPKAHLQELTDLNEQTMKAVTDAAALLSRALHQLYKPDGITICQNGGVFSDLTHFHMHVIPRYRGDGFSWSEPNQDDGASTRLSQTKRRLAQAIGEFTNF